MGLFFPALICGLFCFLGAIESPLGGITLTFYCLGRPLVAGLICGIAFGDVTTGILAGVAVQAVFIANLSTGGATNAEITYAGYGGIGLAMASSASTNEKVALAVTLSVLIGNSFGLIFYNLRMAFYSFYNNKALEAAERGDGAGITMWHMIIPGVTTFVLRFTPVFLGILVGADAVNAFIENVPEIVTHIVEVCGGVLPALGIGMLMNIVIKEPIQLVFFFLGFALLAFAGLGTIPVVFIAAVIAYIMYLTSGRAAAGEVAEVNSDAAAYQDADLF